MFVQALLRAPPDSLVTRTHIEDSLTFGVSDPEDLFDSFRDQLEAFAARKQIAFGTLPGCDVTGDTENAVDVAVVFGERNEPNALPDRAVGYGELSLDVDWCLRVENPLNIARSD